MKTSESVKDLFTSLSKAQGEFSVATKDAKNPFFKSNYADYESVVRACRSQLTKHGLGFTQVFEDTEIGKSITTRIFHESGEWMESSMSFKLLKDDPQTFGSASTYYKRYALQAALGIVASDEDDDAEHAQARHVQSKPVPQQQQKSQPQTESNNSKFASKEQVAEIYAIGRKKKFSDADIFKIIKNVAGDVKSSHEIPSMAVGIIYSFLEKNEPGDLK